MFMSRENLEIYTGRVRRDAIVRQLRSKGIPHDINGDGWPIVSTSYIENRLGGITESKQSAQEPYYGDL